MSKTVWLIAGGVVALVILIAVIAALAFGGGTDPMRAKAEAAADFAQGALTLNSDMLARTLPRKYQRLIPAIVTAANVTLRTDSLVGKAIKIDKRTWDAKRKTLMVEATIPALEELIPAPDSAGDSGSPSAVAFYFVPDANSGDVELRVRRDGEAETLGTLTMAEDGGWRVVSVNGVSVDETLGRIVPNAADMAGIAAGTIGSARDSAQSKFCFANERTCEGVFQTVIADQGPEAVADVASYQDLMNVVVPQYLKQEAVCPSGGEYSVSREGEASGVVVTCSVHGHY